MNSREVFPDEELRRRIMDFIMAAGQTLLENGAEVFRVEQTMEIMARSFHLREFHVYVLTNGIFASAGTAEISEVRNVPTRTTHLGRVAAVNALSPRDRRGQYVAERSREPSGAGAVHPFSQGLGAAGQRHVRCILLCADLRRHTAQCTGGGTGRLSCQRLFAAV